MADDYSGIKWFGGAVAAFLSGWGLLRAVPKAKERDNSADIRELRRDYSEMRAALTEVQAICESLDGRIARREVHDRDVHRDLSTIRLTLNQALAVVERLAEQLPMEPMAKDGRGI